ncbi:ATPase, partial [Mesorhizobium sp. M2A.F.Ca.ET.067.02.1.1]
MNAAIRLPAEQVYAAELQALARGDDRQKPAGWSLSPKAVLTYLMGGKASDGTVISPK